VGSDGRPELVRCEAHGLHFDASRASGCVLCRRASSAPATGAARPHWSWAAVVAGVLVSAASLAAWRHHSRASVASLSGVSSSASAGVLGRSPQLAARRLDPRFLDGAERARAEADFNARVEHLAAQQQSCAQGDTGACLQAAQACNLIGFGPGSRLGVPRLSPQVLQSGQACRSVREAARKLCNDGSLAACDAMRPLGGGTVEQEEHTCDLGSAAACQNLAQLLSAQPLAAEAAKLRGAELQRCEQPKLAPCLAHSRAELAVEASASLKATARETCRSGTPEACNAAAASYASIGPMQDLAFSAELTQTSCNKGNDHACWLLSEILATGRGLPRDERKALELHDRGVAQGREVLEHCETLECGLLRMAEVKMGGDAVEQMRRAEIADAPLIGECDGGKESACEALRAVYSGGKRASSALAAAYGQKANAIKEHACQGGDVASCVTLGNCLIDLPPQDPTRGRALLDRTCTGGSYFACWELGERLSRRSERDPVAAAGYYRRAVALAEPKCDAGDSNACYEAMTAYSVGKGVAQDDKKALEYAHKSNAGPRP
jgi:TPR repeat protein